MHKTQVRVRYEETDQMGVVYHANYLRYFEIGRTEALRDRGMTYAEMERGGLLLAVVEAACTFHSAAYYDNLLTIHTTLTEVRKVRLRFDYEILAEGGGPPLVTGHTTLACLDTDRKPAKLPPAVLAAIQ